jgi:hypothetical protein
MGSPSGVPAPAPLRATARSTAGAALTLGVVVTLTGCAGGGSGPAAPPASDRAAASTDTARPGPTPDPEAETIRATGGSYYAQVERVDPRDATLTVDVLQFYSGAAAARACAQDGVPDQGGALCHAYYIRNRSGRLDTVRVLPDAVIIVGCGAARSSSSHALPGPDRLVRLTIAGGTARRVEQVCLP